MHGRAWNIGRGTSRRGVCLVLAALLGVLGVLAPVGVSAQNTANYMEQGGDVWVVDGELRLHGVSLGIAKGNSRYVQNTTGCSDAASAGKSWSAPWCTVAYALTQVADYDVIRVAGTINEAVTIPYARSHVRLIGGGPTPRAARWKYTTGGAPLITCNGDAAVIANIFFEPPADAAAIKLARNVGQTTAKCNNALVVGVEIWTGKYGVELSGAPHNVQILGSRIRNLRAAGATAIYVSSTADDYPRRVLVRDVLFSGNVNDIVGPFVDSMFMENAHLSAAAGASTTTKIDLRNGSNNMVTRGTLGGTYSNAGGYYAGPNDEWTGNVISTGLTSGNPS